VTTKKSLMLHLQQKQYGKKAVNVESEQSAKLFIFHGERFLLC